LQDGVFVDNPSNFSSTTRKYTFSFTDYALVGRLQTYVLRATIPLNNPGSGSPFTAEYTVNISIVSCADTSLIDPGTFTNMQINLGGS